MGEIGTINSKFGPDSCGITSCLSIRRRKSFIQQGPLACAFKIALKCFFSFSDIIFLSSLLLKRLFCNRNIAQLYAALSGSTLSGTLHGLTQRCPEHSLAWLDVVQNIAQLDAALSRSSRSLTHRCPVHHSACLSAVRSIATTDLALSGTSLNPETVFTNIL